MVAVHDGIDRRHAEKTVAGARNAIELKSVAKEYKAAGGGAFRAVAGVDLEVAEGEFVALVGPSGCGKTTLLRMISALEPPSAGSITIYGEPPGAPPAYAPARHRLPGTALLPWLSVRGNLELPFVIAGRPVEDQGKIAMLLELVRLTDFARARPKQLSGGMRQRVAIAARSFSTPSAAARRAVRRVRRGGRRHMDVELERVSRQSRVTTVLVARSVAEALFLADRVVVMGTKPGRIVPSLPRVWSPRPVRRHAVRAFPQAGRRVDRGDRSGGLGGMKG